MSGTKHPREAGGSVSVTLVPRGPEIASSFEHNILLTSLLLNAPGSCIIKDVDISITKLSIPT